MTDQFLLCNAGVNAASVRPDGTVNVCFDHQEPLGNIFTGFQFRTDLVRCTREFCDCPLWSFEKNLHAIAKGKTPGAVPQYQAFLHWHATYSCNMFCPYCTVLPGGRDKDLEAKRAPTEPFSIDGMMRSLDATGKTFLISFIGGEPFMVPNMTEVCAALTKQHFICFNTNFTKIEPRFFDVVHMGNVGVFNISLHIQPMEVNGLTDVFIRNFKAMRSAGHDRYTITVVAHPNIFPRLKEYRDFFGSHGIQFKLIPMFDGGGSTGGKAYPESYTPEEREVIENDWHAEYYPLKNTEVNDT